MSTVHTCEFMVKHLHKVTYFCEQSWVKLPIIIKEGCQYFVQQIYSNR